MNSEEFMKIIDTLPTIEHKPPISVYESIDVVDLNKVVDRYKTIPSYDLLIKENNKLKEELDELKSDYSMVVTENKKLKYDKDKAIEYIEKILPSMDVKDIDVIKLKDTFWGKELLKILKGE